MNDTLKDLFAVERATHVGTLVSCVKEFALGNKVNEQTIQQFLRAAHSLKGAARLVNDLLVEKTAHQLESLVQEKVTNSEYPQAIISESVLNLFKNHLRTLGVDSLELIGGITPASSSVQSEGVCQVTESDLSKLNHLASEVALSMKRIENLLNSTSVSDNTQTRVLVNQGREEAERGLELARRLQSQTLQLQLVSIQDAMRSLHTMTQDLAVQLDKSIRLVVKPGYTLIDRSLARLIEPALIQLIRNSIDHGIETKSERELSGKSQEAVIELSARQRGTTVEVKIRDDGRGIGHEQIRQSVIEKGLHSSEAASKLTNSELEEFIFLPGFSTKKQVGPVSGRGIGLDIVRANLREVLGDVTVSSEHGKGTTFTVTLPGRLSVLKALIIEVSHCAIALPLSSIQGVVPKTEYPIQHVDGVPCLIANNQVVHLLDSQRLFSLPRPTSVDTLTNISHYVLFPLQEQMVALPVDKILGETDILIHPLDARFKQNRAVLGVGRALDRDIVTIINTENLSPVTQKNVTKHASINTHIEKRQILIVDDSPTVRELERRILMLQGYECTIAEDGLDALGKIDSAHFDLVITDIDMPRMDGFGLIQGIRSRPNLHKTPILVVSYKDRVVDREKSISLGAQAYLSKGSFKDDSFVQTVSNLLLQP